MPAPSRLLALVALVFVVSAACTWLTRRVARQRGWLAPMRPDRWHSEPTALFGGVGIFVAFVAGLVVAVPASPARNGLIVLTALMFLTGLIDDSRDIRPQTKVVVQVTSGLLLFSSGFHFNDAIVWWIDMAIVVFWVVAITNALNLLDNMNGLAAGTAIIAGVFRLMLFHQTGNVEGAMATAVFIGAVAGFLLFNFPRASIFMGDSGSFTIGFALAALNLSSSEAYSKSLFSVLVFPVLLLAIPIFDTTFVSVVRYFSGRAISQGGRDHTSHRLVAIGLSETSAVLMLWGISAAGGLVAFGLYSVGFSYALFMAALLVLGLVLFGVVLSRVRVYAEGSEPPGPMTAWGFVLPGEVKYKRQLLWVFVDGGTILLGLQAVAFVVALLSSPALPLETALEAPSAALAPFAPATSVALAGMMLALVTFGLYRVDWPDFDLRQVGIITGGAAAGLVARDMTRAVTGTGDTWTAVTFAATLVAIVVALCTTRVFVHLLDRWLRAIGRAREGGPL